MVDMNAKIWFYGGNIIEGLQLMRDLYLSLVLVTTLLGHSAAALSVIPESQDPDSIQADDFVLSSSEVARFDYGGKSWGVWSSIKNRPDSPGTWQFRYEPIFSPVLNDGGALATSIESIGGETQVWFHVLLDDPSARRAAFQSVRDALGEGGGGILEANCAPIRVRSLLIDLPDLSRVYPGCSLLQNGYEFASTQNIIRVQVVATNRTVAEQLAADLQKMRVKFELNFSARESQQTMVSANLKAVWDIKLKAALRGTSPDASGCVYVHRDDVREIFEGLTVAGAFDVITENPERVDRSFADAVVSGVSSVEQLSDGKAHAWESTYHADDLKPSQITRAMNEAFTKTQSRDEFEYNSRRSSSGKFDFFGMFSGGGSGGSTYSSHQIRERLFEHGIHVEFDGEAWVAKSVDVRRFNLSDLQSEVRVVQTFVEVSSPRRKDLRGEQPLVSPASVTLPASERMVVGSFFVHVRGAHLPSVGPNDTEWPELRGGGVSEVLRGTARFPIVHAGRARSLHAFIGGWKSEGGGVHDCWIQIGKSDSAGFDWILRKGEGGAEFVQVFYVGIF